MKSDELFMYAFTDTPVRIVWINRSGEVLEEKVVLWVDSAPPPPPLGISVGETVNMRDKFGG